MEDIQRAAQVHLNLHEEMYNIKYLQRAMRSEESVGSGGEQYTTSEVRRKA